MVGIRGKLDTHKMYHFLISGESIYEMWCVHYN